MLEQGDTCPPPDSLVAPPQIQKLADRSDVIFEVPKCKFSGAKHRTLLGELTALHQTP